MGFGKRLWNSWVNIFLNKHLWIICYLQRLAIFTVSKLWFFDRVDTQLWSEPSKCFIITCARIVIGYNLAFFSRLKSQLDALYLCIFQYMKYTFLWNTITTTFAALYILLIKLCFLGKHCSITFRLCLSVVLAHNRYTIPRHHFYDYGSLRSEVCKMEK